MKYWIFSPAPVDEVRMMALDSRMKRHKPQHGPSAWLDGRLQWRAWPVLLLALAMLLPAPWLEAAGKKAAGRSAPGKIGMNQPPYEARGMVIPRLQSTLSSPLPAIIRFLQLDKGGHFKKGQLLVSMDCSILEAQRLKVVAELEGKQLDHQARQRLFEFKSISELDVRMSLTRVRQVEAQLAVMDTRLRQCQLAAPFSGRVVKRHAHPFQFVEEGDPLLEVIDDSHSQLEMIVPSPWLSWLKRGDYLTVLMDETQKRYKARLTTIGARVDPVSQTIELRADIEGHHPELLSGMSGRVIFKPEGRP